MKRKRIGIVVVLVISLAVVGGGAFFLFGPSSGDAGTQTTPPTAENVTITETNETDDADYRIGSLPNSSMDSHSMFIINKRSIGNVTATVHPTDAPNNSINKTLKPGDMLELTINYPSEYTIELSDPVGETVTVDSTEFGCEFNLHTIGLTDSGVNTTTETNSQSC